MMNWCDPFFLHWWTKLNGELKWLCIKYSQLNWQGVLQCHAYTKGRRDSPWCHAHTNVHFDSKFQLGRNSPTLHLSSTVGGMLTSVRFWTSVPTVHHVSPVSLIMSSCTTFSTNSHLDFVHILVKPLLCYTMLFLFSLACFLFFKWHCAFLRTYVTKCKYWVCICCNFWMWADSAEG